jgi:hypothetical protein
MMKKRLLFLLILSLLSINNLYSQNRCVIKMDGKTGYIDTLGNVVIPTIYESGIQFSEGLAAVKLNGKWGYIDISGRKVIDFKFSSAEHFSNGYARVVVDTCWGVINSSGHWVIKPTHEMVEYMNEGFIAIEKNEKWAFFDLKRKKYITKFIYEDLWSFHEGLAMVKIGKNYGFINTKGKVALDPIYRQVRMMGFSCGLACVRNQEGKWGYIDKTGKVIIDYKFGEADWFQENKAFVQDKWGEPGYFIDKNGKRIFDKTFDKVWAFKDGLCGVTINKKYGVIDSMGNWLVEPKYDWLHVFYQDGWIAYFNFIEGKAKWGILDSKGKEILPAKYSNVVKNDGDCILPEIYLGDCPNNINDCKRGYANLRGEIIWQPTQ